MQLNQSIRDERTERLDKLSDGCMRNEELCGDDMRLLID